MADDQGQGPGTDQEENEVEDQNSQGDGEQQDSSGDDGAADKGGETVSKADFDKIFARMQAADRAKGEAEKKLREKEQAEMTELDRTKSQLEDQKTRADQAEAKLNAMIIENAFHRENKFIWHDVGDAVAALDLSGVEVGEDGKVSGMAKAIQDVVKRKPHYVKSNQEQDQGEGNGPPAANGANNGQRKGDPGKGVDAKKLVARFPALGK